MWNKTIIRGIMQVMKYWMLTGLVAILLVFIGVQLLSSHQPIPKANIPTPTKVVSTPLTPENLLKFVNDERAKNGVAPLVIDERLNQSAQLKADDMQNNHYFGHVNPTTGLAGIQYAHELLNDCSSISENIVEATSTEDAMSLWINSPSHHEAMIDRKHSLTGFATSGKNVVEHFCEL